MHTIPATEVSEPTGPLNAGLRLLVIAALAVVIAGAIATALSDVATAKFATNRAAISISGTMLALKIKPQDDVAVVMVYPKQRSGIAAMAPEGAQGQLAALLTYPLTDIGYSTMTEQIITDVRSINSGTKPQRLTLVTSIEELRTEKYDKIGSLMSMTTLYGLGGITVYSLGVYAMIVIFGLICPLLVARLGIHRRSKAMLLIALAALSGFPAWQPTMAFL